VYLASVNSYVDSILGYLVAKRDVNRDGVLVYQELANGISASLIPAPLFADLPMASLRRIRMGQCLNTIVYTYSSI
jgi:hypothetical protein